MSTLIPEHELKASAEAGIVPKECPIAISIDPTPTLNGEVRYAVAFQGDQETIFVQTSISSALFHIDQIKQACLAFFDVNEERFSEERQELVEAFDQTISEIKRRQDIERGGGDDNGPDAA